MGVIENLIPVGSSRFTQDLGLWYSSTGQEITRTTTKSFVSGVPSMSVKANIAGSAKVLLDRIDISESYRGKKVRAFAWIYTTSSSPCTIYLTTVVGSASASVQTTENLRGYEWSLVSVESDVLSTVQNSHASIAIDVTGLANNEEVFIALPALTVPEMVLTTVSGDETYLRLPDYMRRADLDQSEPELPLRRFVDVLTTLANDIDTTWNLFYYVPPEDNNGVPLRSYLTEPDLADEATLKWLAMVMGTTLQNPSTGFTPWTNLLDGADTNSDGQTTWNELVAEVDGPDLNSTLEWSEIETFAPAFIGLSPYERWQVSSAAYGLRAGSVASIKAAALWAFQVADRSSKTVTVTPNYLNDPFHILVEIDTMDVSEIGTVEEFVNPAIPAGFGVTVAVA